MEPLRDRMVIYDERFPPYGGRSEPRQQSDWQQRIDMNKLRRDRHANLVHAMKDAGISVMMLMLPENMRYGTGYAPLKFRVGHSYVIVPVEGEPVVHGNGFCAIQDRREMAWMKPENIRTEYLTIPGPSGTMETEKAGVEFTREQIASIIKQDLEEMKVSKEVLHFDAPSPDLQATFEKAGVRTAVSPQVPAKAQEIKTPEEIECFRVCAAIADIVHWETAAYAKPGMTEFEITGYIKYRALAYGGELDVGSFCVSGEHTWPNYRQSTDRMIRPGDIVYWDVFQVSWNGYHSCTYRTFSAGFKASQAAQDAYKKIHEWTYNALAECRPGKTTADMMKHFPEYGEGEPEAGCIMHGLGLTNYGAPYGRRRVSMNSPYELKEGHVFAIEPEAGIGDGQGVRFEEMCVVTETGVEVLTRFPSNQIITIPMRDDQGIVYVPPEAHLREAAKRLNLPYVEPMGGMFTP